jgi:hypothetical protein
LFIAGLTGDTHAPGSKRAVIGDTQQFLHRPDGIAAVRNGLSHEIPDDNGMTAPDCSERGRLNIGSRKGVVAMARPIRIEYAGAVYPVMACGNQGQTIFGDDVD